MLFRSRAGPGIGPACPGVRAMAPDFIRRGRPVGNGHIESVERKPRGECLAANRFLSIDDAQGKIEAWWLGYDFESDLSPCTDGALKMQIPAGTDLYGELPRPYRNVRWLSVYCETATKRLAAVIPAPLQLLDPARSATLFEVFIAHYGDTPYGPYTEAGVIVPCRFADIAGQTFAPFLYLDQVGPIVGGRELMGFPKKDAELRFAQDGDLVRGGMTRGAAPLEIEGRPSAAAELDFEPLPSGPRLIVQIGRAHV